MNNTKNWLYLILLQWILNIRQALAVCDSVVVVADSGAQFNFYNDSLDVFLVLCNGVIQTWANAKIACEALTITTPPAGYEWFSGLLFSLASIDSAYQNQVFAYLLSGNTYIGGQEISVASNTYQWSLRDGVVPVAYSNWSSSPTVQPVDDPGNIDVMYMQNSNKRWTVAGVHTTARNYACKSILPTASPSATPTRNPTPNPTRIPTYNPTSTPSSTPTRTPTRSPTYNPTSAPTRTPTSSPSRDPTFDPTMMPTESPSFNPTNSKSPTRTPTRLPTSTPTYQPTHAPSFSLAPTNIPTISPTGNPTTSAPTMAPTITFSPTYTQSPTTVEERNIINKNSVANPLTNILYLASGGGILFIMLLIGCGFCYFRSKRKEAESSKIVRRPTSGTSGKRLQTATMLMSEQDDLIELEFALDDEDAGETYASFAVKENSLDNFTFLRDSRNILLKIVGGAADAQVKVLLDALWNKYLSPGAFVDISVSSNAKQVVMGNLSRLGVVDCDSSTSRPQSKIQIGKDSVLKAIIPAIKECKKAILSDSWPNFRESFEYKQRFKVLFEDQLRKDASGHSKKSSVDIGAVALQLAETKQANMTFGILKQQSSDMDDGPPLSFEMPANHRSLSREQSI